jgi:hypothetical protein
MKSSTALALLIAVGAMPACALDLEGPEVAETNQYAITPVPDLEGLPGYYRRVPYLGAPIGELRGMWLVGDEHEGEYTRTVASLCIAPGCNVEAGYYWAVPNNPVMGFAFIGFFDEDGESTDYYIIDFITHDLFGNIETMQMRKVYEERFGIPFAVMRIF